MGKCYTKSLGFTISSLKQKMWDEQGQRWIVEGIVINKKANVRAHISNKHHLVPLDFFQAKRHVIHPLTKGIQCLPCLDATWWLRRGLCCNTWSVENYFIPSFLFGSIQSV